MMMKSLIVLFAIACIASAQILPDTAPARAGTCPAGYILINKSAYYSTTFTGVSSICVKPYLNACATTVGLQPCNTANQQCTPVAYSWDNKVQFPAVAAIMLQAPEICISAGTVRASDTSVVIIAQIIFSGIVFIAAFIVFLVKVDVSILIKALVALYLILCLILLFSYYYLNAIVMMLCVFSAAGCLSFKTNSGYTLCCAILLIGFFWVTYSDGLGYLQHQSRIVSANAVDINYYGGLCDTYYNNLFAWANDAHGDNENIAILHRGFCAPGWLSAELFFMILCEQLIMPFIALASWSHFRNHETRSSPVKTLEE